MADIDFPTNLLDALDQATMNRDGKPEHGEIRFRCPSGQHEDRHPSARWNRTKAVWHCDVCQHGGGALALADTPGVEKPRPPRQGGGGASSPPVTGATVQPLADTKRLPADELRQHGLRELTYLGAKAVAIPYYGPQPGTVVATRYRIALDGPDRFRWKKGDHPALYGLWRLDEARTAGWVLIVEGESDCWTAWHHGLPCVGVPGKAMWKPEWAAHVDGLDVLIWQEPDAADFTRRVAATLPGARVIVAPPGIKDLSAAHMAGKDVPALMRRWRRAAVPVADIVSVFQPLDDVSVFLRRFVAYPSADAHVAHTLWVAHAHLMDAWESTPRLAFLSPEPASGKTRALEVTELLVPNPVEAVNVTPAYLFRKVGHEDGRPTILYDEIDTVFGPKAKDNEEIRGLLNAGHRVGAVAGRCVVRGKIVETEEIPAYCAVAMAGLGGLPDTILSRAVHVRMRRRRAGEHVEAYRRRIEAPAGHELRDRLAAWADTVRARVADAWPQMPEGIEDRDADIWEPLLAVADAAGGDWPARARVAAVALVADSKESTPSLGIRLLADLRTVFGDADAMSTDDILTALQGLEEAPWGELVGGKPLNARGLARRLGEYGVKSKTVRIGATTPRGYAREDLADAWSRYLPSPPQESATSATSATNATSAPSGHPSLNAPKPPSDPRAAFERSSAPAGGERPPPPSPFAAEMEGVDQDDPAAEADVFWSRERLHDDHGEPTCFDCGGPAPADGQHWCLACRGAA